ncbi:hypothetical protein [Pararhizobium capsulatum]|uniref:hypothetical protein n=1 Tax=Pararhizobium capsulatum TaxID=34014 RepID=UPI0035218513
MVIPNYHGDEYDRRMSLTSIETTREILSQSAIAKYIKIERLPARCEVQRGYHGLYSPICLL